MECFKKQKSQLLEASQALGFHSNCNPFQYSVATVILE